MVVGLTVTSIAARSNHISVILTRSMRGGAEARRRGGAEYGVTGYVSEMPSEN
jgi:hypothetical protein